MVELPYPWGKAEGLVVGMPASRNFSGFGDIGGLPLLSILSVPPCPNYQCNPVYPYDEEQTRQRFLRPAADGVSAVAVRCAVPGIIRLFGWRYRASL